MFHGSTVNLASIIQQEKLQKAATKAEDAEHKKLEKEKQKWAKDKALKSVVALIDNKLVEESVGGKDFLHSMYHSSTYTSRLSSSSLKYGDSVPSIYKGRLISGLQEKGITYRVTSNPIERSIVWTMTLPEHIAQVR